MHKRRKELPVVSVIMITYAHESYVEEAVNGVYMQQTDFPVELIIANDNSPDQTHEVVQNVIDKAPDNVTVKYTKHDTNKGMIPNFVWALEQAKGKYIALCEGDDYWTDPLKLQKQVAFLEENDDYVLCFTNRDILNSNVIEISKPLYNKVSFDKAEIPYRYAPTLTVVFRNVVKHIPSKLHNSLIDASLFLFLSQYGCFYYFDQSMAVYRVHADGIWSGSTDLANYRRSTKARVSAWVYLKNVDRLSLAHVIKPLLNLRKESELNSKMYLSAFRSVFIGYFFNIYVLIRIIKQKIKNR